MDKIKKLLPSFIAFAVLFNVIIISFVFGVVVAVTRMGDIKIKNTDLEIEKCNLQTSLIDLSSEYDRLVMETSGQNLSSEEFLRLWEEVKDKKMDIGYLECLNRI